MTAEDRAKARAKRYVNPDDDGYESPLPHLPTPAEQGEHLRGMVDMTQRAFAEENKRRVSQAEDERAYQHEIAMERLKQDGLMRRLAAMNAEKEAAKRAEPKVGPDGSYSRTFNPKTHTWEYN